MRDDHEAAWIFFVVMCVLLFAMCSAGEDGGGNYDCSRVGAAEWGSDC
jgi:hypothetical protein